MNWEQFTSIKNGTRIYNHGFDECVALANLYHESVLGGKFVPVAAAHQWWTTRQANIDAIYTRSSVPVVGAVYVSRGGIYNAPFGHIGVVTGVNANGSFQTIEQNGGQWRFVGKYTRKNDSSVLGFLIPKKNPANQKLEPHQRRVGSNPVKRRTDATTKSKEKKPSLAPGTVGNFTAWKHGQKVKDSVTETNIWFQGVSGDWFWAGGFTSQSTKNLKDANPQNKPKAGQRQVKGDMNSNVRKTPSTKAEITGEIKANKIVTPEGWVTGEKYGGVDTWFKVAGGFAWGGSFTNAGTANLKNLNPADPHKRTAKALPVNIRKAPATNTEILGLIEGGGTVTITGWAEGETVDGLDTWFVLENGFAWAGAFTTQSVAGLPKVEIEKPDPPEWSGEGNPNDVGPGPVLGTIRGWNDVWAPSFDRSFPRHNPRGDDLKMPSWLLIERIPVVADNHNYGREGAPNHAVIHHTATNNLESARNTLKSAGAPSTNNLVVDSVIYEMVDHRDTPATNNRWKSNTFSTTWELLNSGSAHGKPSPQTHETAAWGIARDAIRYGWELPLDRAVNVWEHREIAKEGYGTACPGDVNTDWITKRANEIIVAHYSGKTPPEPDYSSLEESINNLSALIERLIDLLKRIFRVNSDGERND